MSKGDKFLLITVAFFSGVSLLFFLFSLIKLGGAGDGNPILTPMRIINRDVAAVSFAILLLTRYLWKKK